MAEEPPRRDDERTPPPVQISIDDDGVVRVNGRPATKRELGILLAEAIKSKPD